MLVVVSHGVRRAAVVVLVGFVAVPLGGLAGCKDRKAAPPPPSQPAGPVGAATPPSRDLAFVRGEVLVSSEATPLPQRLDPTTGTWSAIGSGDVRLYPTGLRLRGGHLCIATRGVTEEDHVEQLAIVRGPAVEPLGPTAPKIRNPSVTPDGARVVFESDRLSYRDLYALGLDGSIVRLTDNAEGNFEPALAPDGATLAFASSRDGNAELYSQPLAGGAPTRLSTTPRDEWGAAWSPDGTTLAFLSDRDGSARAYRTAPTGGPATRLTAEAEPEAAEDRLRWSPDGKTLALVRSEGTAHAVVLVDVASGVVRSITPAQGADLDFAWSPDGAHLATIRTADRQPHAKTVVTFVRVSDGAVVGAVEAAAAELRWVAD